MSIIFAILIFSFLIFIHEFGHFFTAKLSGVRVNEFAMFMGPAIWKKKKGETLYSIRCIPIGGYCAMEGEDQDTDDPRSFQKAAWWKRLIILVAGSAMNLLAGFLIVLVVNLFTWTAFLHVDDIRAGSSLSEQGGIQAGDTILQIDDFVIDETADWDAALAPKEEIKQADVLVLRDGQEILLEDVNFELREFQADDGGEAGKFYGITISWNAEPSLRQDFGNLLSDTWDDCVYFAKAIWMGLGDLLSGKVGVEDMSGPVGIVDMMNDVATSSSSFGAGFLQLMTLAGFIAINLGIMNMLPIPALDGGRVLALLVTTLITKITKKPVNPKIEGYIHAGGMILLLLFMAFIMFNDIYKIFAR